MVCYVSGQFLSGAETRSLLRFYVLDGAPTLLYEFASTISFTPNPNDEDRGAIRKLRHARHFDADEDTGMTHRLVTEASPLAHSEQLVKSAQNDGSPS